MKINQYATDILLFERFEPMFVDFSYDEVVEHLFDLLRTEPNVPHVEQTKTTEQKRLAIRAYFNVRFPGDLYKRLLLLSDTLLQQELAQKNIAVPTGEELVTLWQGDITTLQADAIVNAGNDQLRGCFHPLHNCIDNTIHSAAGPQLRADCDIIMASQGHPELVGGAKVTRGYNLPAKFVIHTVGPNVAGAPLTPIIEAQLASCYTSVLNVAHQMKEIETLAFCSISTGEFRFPKQRAAEIAVETTKNWLANQTHHFKQIIFNTFSDEDTAIYQKLI